MTTLLFSKPLTSPQGVTVSHHAVSRVELSPDLDRLCVYLDSWPAEAQRLARQAASARWAMSGPVAGLDLSQGLLGAVRGVVLSSEFFQGAVQVQDASDTLDAAKTRKLAELQAARDAAIYGGMVWDGSTFNTDQVAQTRILGLGVSALAPDYAPRRWRLADNTWRTLTADDAAALWRALEQHLEAAYVAFAEREAAVAAAQSRDAVDAL